MSEILDYAMRMHIFPFSALLVLMILFWLTVIIGAADINLFDFDLDVDADVDMDLDVNSESDPSFFRSLADFLNLAEVPFMVLLTFFVLDWNEDQQYCGSSLFSASTSSKFRS